MKTETLSKILIPVVILSAMAAGLYLANTQYDEYTYNFYPLHLNNIDNNTIASIEDCVQGYVFGWQLPYKDLKLIYPNDYNISKVIITYNQTEYIPIDYEPIKIIDECRDGIYKVNNTNYNANIVYENGYPILNVDIYPIEYIEDNSTLIYRKEIKVYVAYEYDLKMRASEIGVRDIVDVENDRWGYDYDIPASTFYTGGLCNKEPVDYVIVTSESLVDEFNRLKEFRENTSNLICRILSIEDILSTYTGEDEPEQLREFCKDAYQDWNITYMVLGGDSNIIPTRIFTDRECTYSYNTMPCDLYYSNLDGTWYAEANTWGGGKYGPNDIDSEFYIGRIVASTGDQVNNAIDKIIFYETCNDIDWLYNATFLGGDLSWGVTSKDYMEEIRLGESPYVDFVGFEEWDNGSIVTSTYYHADYPTESDAVNSCLEELNNDNVSVINHLDHGSWLNTLSLGTGSQLHNTKYPIAVSGACLSGRFTETNSGAYSFMSKDDTGCSLLMLNTGYGWGSAGSTAGATQYLHRYIWDYFFTSDKSEWQFGKALDYARDQIVQRIPYSSFAWAYAWYSLNLFGDPAMEYRLPDSIISLDIGHNYLTYYGDTTSTKNISDDIGLDDGETVSVYHNNTWYAWITNFTPIELNEIVFDGDYVDIIVTKQYEWMR